MSVILVASTQFLAEGRQDHKRKFVEREESFASLHKGCTEKSRLVTVYFAGYYNLAKAILFRPRDVALPFAGVTPRHV